MRLLLDTQALLWFDEGSSRLSHRAKALLEDPMNDLLLSAASYWEIAIKVSTKKLVLATPFHEFITRVIADNSLTILPIEVVHCAELISLPFHHRDPFDRVMIAQSIIERVPVVTSDDQFEKYPVTRLWD